MDVGALSVLIPQTSTAEDEDMWTKAGAYEREKADSRVPLLARLGRL